MITLSTSGNSVIFAFQDNQHYLQNGTIEVPKNSLSLVTDDSNMATFKKSASNDIFLSALYSELGMTKAELETWFEENAVGSTGGGGGGISSGEVQTMIDASISGKADSSAVTAVNNTLTGHTADTTIHVTSSDKSTWSGKQDALVSGTNIKTINNQSLLGSGNITISGGSGGSNAIEVTQAEYDALVSGGTVDPDTFYIITDAEPINLSGYAQSSAVTEEIAAAVSGKADTSAVTASINAAVSGKASQSDLLTVSGQVANKQDTLVSGTNIKTINNESILGSGNIDIQGGGAVSSAITSGDTNAVAGGAVYDKFDEVEQVTARALVDLNDKFDGLRLKRITQEAYDILPVKDDNTLYIISSGAPASWITIPEGTELSALTAYKVRVPETTLDSSHDVTFGFAAFDPSGNTYTLAYDGGMGEWQKWRIIEDGQIVDTRDALSPVDGYYTVDFDGNKYPCIGADYDGQGGQLSTIAPFEFEIYI